MDFSKFDSQIDIEDLKADIATAKENSGNYEDIPHGTYEVKIEKLELCESKKGDPMVSCWFRIVSEEHKNGVIFMNQVITQGFQIHIINEFLRSLGTNNDIVFENFVQYNTLINQVLFDIKYDKLEYALEYGERKGFNTFKIVEVFENN